MHIHLLLHNMEALISHLNDIYKELPHKQSSSLTSKIHTIERDNKLLK